MLAQAVSAPDLEYLALPAPSEQAATRKHFLRERTWQTMEAS
jgi:hypothetical protein